MTLTPRALLQAIAGQGEGIGRNHRTRLGSRFARWSLMCWALGCAPTGPGSDKLPPSVQDPSVVKTPSGAMGFYRAVVASMSGPIDPLIVDVGLMTDELTALPMPTGASGRYTLVDSRQLDDPNLFGNLGTPYARLHQVRGQAEEARGFLSAYLPDSSALRGHLFALEGYADVLLADVFCSGIPLSTVDFGADYTLASGSTTEQVYTAAVTLFDSALVLTRDSVRLQQFAAVGRGRALLALGQYAEAAAAVAAVPIGFRYEVVTAGTSMLEDFAVSFQGAGGGARSGLPTMGDREGQTGLDYRSSGDPRTPAAMMDGQDYFGNTMYFPAKYPQWGPTTFVVADGIEARLIEAEAALQARSSEWLPKLNALRTNGTYDTQPNANDPSQTDTLWHAGTGGVAGLDTLGDPSPGAPAGPTPARVDLLFRERAFWLYLTAHRQGDLRRLIRQYQRAPETVYPTGTYLGGSGRYGSDVTVPVPESEAQYNPNYTGCVHRNA